MKTVFILNPGAGREKNIEKIAETIKNTAKELGATVEIYITKAAYDATEFVREYCKKFGGARFIACGGDGTLSEVINGAIDCKDAEIGVIPMGTGNDFCRNFKGDFENLKSQISAKSVACDAIRYTTEVDGKKYTGVCANMFNIGFDCNVADMTANMKKKRFVSGSMAYFVSILAMLIKKKGANLKVELDGEEKHNGELLLMSVANGCFCGGGIKSNPLASIKDGLININIIRNVSRLKFVRLLPHYMKGTHMQLRGIDKIISSQKCKKVTVTPTKGRLRLCTDGEISDAGKIEFEIMPEAFKFVLPL